MQYGALGAAMMILTWTIAKQDRHHERMLGIVENHTKALVEVRETIANLAHIMERMVDTVDEKLHG